jgi:hypothetical protein
VTFEGNYVSRSYGAGVMVFGHVPGSNTGLALLNNTLLHNGCGQARGDHGGIAFMRPGSSGALTGNTMATCPGVPLLNDAADPGLPGWRVAGNVVDGEGGVALRVEPPPAVAASALPGGGARVLAAPGAGGSSGAALRYTLDGRRPGPADPLFPSGGLQLPPAWRAVAVLVKAFPPPAAAAGGGGRAAGEVGVESESGGGVFAPEE